MIITNKSMEAAIAAAGFGWSSSTDMVCVVDLATPGYCNGENCAAYVSAAERGGATESAFATAVAIGIGDPSTDPPTPRDESALRSIIAKGKSFSSAIASIGLSWQIVGVPTDAPTDSTILVWDPSDRSTTEVLVMHEGSPVSPREYYAAGDAAGATTDDLAAALRDLVDGDPTMFDAIMSA